MTVDSESFAPRPPIAKRSTSSDCQAIFGANAVEIIALVAELAPKMLDAGKSVADLWRAAGGIITDAEKAGKVDADAAMRLKALVDVQLTALDRNADEAGAG